ncbi:MAG: ABC transporter ATP-binding protein [Victivallales bacterium]|nr:ABC transporter ATP-binding protein [Victivallales bacterium]
MPEATNILYRLEKLCRDFKLNRGTIHVLKDLELELPANGWIALVGRSGSGKTTLLQLLGGLDRPTAGKIFFRGQDLARLSGAKLTRLRRREFGFVFQAYHLLPELSAWENAALPALAWNNDREKTYSRAKELLEQFGLAGRLHHRPPELSGGEQQRVAIARALINDPPVILADEPTGNLDENAARHVVKIFQELREKQGKTIIMVTHDAKIANLADRQFRLG